MRTIPFERQAYSDEFIQYIVDKRGWSDLSNDCIMDIGCGKGMEMDSIHCFTVKFPNFKKLIGIDIDYVEDTRTSNDNIVFHVADITDISTLEEWIGGVTKIISHTCFNCFDEHCMAFANVFQLLTPGGEAAVEFTLQSDFSDWVYEISQRWPELSKDMNTDKPLSHVEKHRAPYYKVMLKDFGFNVLACEDEAVLYVFISDEQCKTYLRQICFFDVEKCTEDEKQRFEEDSFETFLRCTSRDGEGNITMKKVILRVIIKKPTAGTVGIVQTPSHS